MRCRTPSTGSFRHDEEAAPLHKLTPHKRLALNMMNRKKTSFYPQGPCIHTPPHAFHIRWSPGYTGHAFAPSGQSNEASPSTSFPQMLVPVWCRLARFTDMMAEERGNVNKNEYKYKQLPYRHCNIEQCHHTWQI